MPLFLASIISIYVFGVNYRNILSYSDTNYNCDFVITDTFKESENFYSYEIKLTKIGNTNTGFKARFNTENKLENTEYYKYNANLSFSKITKPSNENSPYHSYLSKGILLDATTNEPPTLQNECKIFPDYYFHKINSYLSTLSNKTFDEETNSLIQALLLGNKLHLSPKTSYNFRALGLSHVLAVSGLHLSILVNSIGIMLSKTTLPKRRRYLFMIAITFAYAGITGFSPSIKRAAIMLVLFYASFLFSRTNDNITSLCSALALICLISPYSVFDLGLWLSFLSTYGILQVGQPLVDRAEEEILFSPSILQKTFIRVCSPLLFNMIPIFFSLPAIWLSYREIAVFSPLTNIFFSPFINILMITSPLALIFTNIPLLSTISAFIASTVSKIILSAADFLANYSPLVSINYSFTIFLIIALVLALAILVLRRTKSPLVYFLPIASSIIIFTLCASLTMMSTKNDQKAIISNTYMGDSFTIISENKALICDISGMSYPNALASYYALQEYNITEIDGYIATNYHARGIDTLENLISLTKIHRMYFPAPLGKDEKLLQSLYVDFAQKHNIILYEYNNDSPHQIEFHGINVSVTNTTRAAANNMSGICISLASEHTSYHYISKGVLSTFDGISLVNTLVSNENNLIFGAYGPDKPSLTDTMLYTKNKNLYFTNKSVFSLYSKYLPELSSITVLNDRLTFNLN